MKRKNWGREEYLSPVANAAYMWSVPVLQRRRWNVVQHGEAYRPVERRVRQRHRRGVFVQDGHVRRCSSAQSFCRGRLLQKAAVYPVDRLRRNVRFHAVIGVHANQQDECEPTRARLAPQQTQYGRCAAKISQRTVHSRHECGIAHGVVPSVNPEIYQDVGIGGASQALMAALKQALKG
jgi:hypothetical protein